MGEEIKVILVGASGSPKCWLANRILKVRNDSEEDSFLEGEYDLATCQPIRKDVDGKRYYVVATPDISDGSSPRFWKNLIIAQDFCGTYVNVFIIVLDFENPHLGRKLIENFMNIFGREARSKCIVVYTNMPVARNDNLERELQCNFDFVSNILTDGYPLIKLTQNYNLRNTNITMSTLRNSMDRIANGSSYNFSFFKDEQLTFLEKWVGNKIIRAPLGISTESLIDNLSVPEELMSKIFVTDTTRYNKALHIMKQRVTFL